MNLPSTPPSFCITISMITDSIANTAVAPRASNPSLNGLNLICSQPCSKSSMITNAQAFNTADSELGKKIC